MEMPALARRSSSVRLTRRHTTLHVTTRQATEFVDLTDRLATIVAEADLRFGLLNLHTRHTTTGVVLNEHEPQLLTDFRVLLEGAAPNDGRYRHDDMAARTTNVIDGERPNGHAHCRALLLPSSLGLNIVGGRLLLGRWQRVFLVELDGPREREVSVLVFGETGQ
jgi:secondary thiamine-phosphate synthase enzyme